MGSSRRLTPGQLTDSGYGEVLNVGVLNGGIQPGGTVNRCHAFGRGIGLLATLISMARLATGLVAVGGKGFTTHAGRPNQPHRQVQGVACAVACNSRGNGRHHIERLGWHRTNLNL